ncbi:MBL fold metallo-hydrolase [Micromonospora sp. WMMD1102]|nr:MBL fold metallo-hydrolase [Micromonospora sp. WMMD1102]MDG4786371.1 MBL fold metallo-hydrolase [Micromonospora sp. WMMD1102]
MTSFTCHPHLDHCGGNPELAGRPIVVQRTELALAGAPGHPSPN